MLSYTHDLDENSIWLIVNSSQIPWNADATNVIPYIQELGEFHANVNYFTEREDVPSYLIKYVTAGRGILNYQGQNYTVQTGDCFWIDCREYQKYYTDPEIGKWDMLWLHFYGQQCHEYYRMFCELGKGPVFRMAASEELEETIRALIEQYRCNYSDATQDIQTAAVLVRIMADAILSRRKLRASRTPPEFISLAQVYIAKNYASRISLDTLCENLHVSKHYFIRQFKEYLGVTPHQYIIRHRIHKAKILLRQSEDPISQIAEQTGFDQPAHFINCFKKMVGMSPNRYRGRIMGHRIDEGT